MPRTLSSGATGSDVIELQSRLNNAPSGSVPLDVDGIFGPKTRARVVEFQARKGLAADGIVGPKTWAALLEGTGGLDLPRRTGIDCGTGDPANKGLVSLIANLFGQGLAALGIIPAGAGFNLSGSGSLASLSLPAPPTFRKLTPGEVITATGVFGSSIDFSTVFISDKSGAQNRAFTAAIPVPAALAASFGIGSGMVQVMNLGSRFAAPGRDLLIHELTHVWQSQHATSKVKFMANSLACQGAAIAANLAAVADALADFDLAKAKAIRSNADFPGFYPFSAYAHIRGKPFNAYAAEQIANQVEHGVGPIVAHVAGVATGAIDPDNDKSLTNDTNSEDVRLSTVRP